MNDTSRALLPRRAAILALCLAALARAASAAEPAGAEPAGAADARLFAAILAGDEGGALAALESGADPDAVDGYGLSALNYASSLGLERTVLVLLDRGAAVDYQDPWGMTSLHAACKEGRDGIALLLLSRGASPSLRTRAGYYVGFTALHAAVFFGAAGPGTVRALLAAGADPRATDASGRSPLDMARARGDRVLAGLLQGAP